MMPALRGKRKRKSAAVTQEQKRDRKRKMSEHSATIAALKPRFIGLDEKQILSIPHPLELLYSDITLNPLQRAMVFCINFCGGAATDDELEAFCELYWKAIEQKSQRRTDYSGCPNKRIFKIIFSIKRNGFPLFVECPGDKNKHQVYVPQKQFQDRVLDLLRDSSEGYTIQELADKLDGIECDGFFKELSCLRRVRAQLLIYKRQHVVEFCEQTDKWRIKKPQQCSVQDSGTPHFLRDVKLNNISVAGLYDEIQKRKSTKQPM